MGGKPSKSTKPDMRLKENKPAGTKATKAVMPTKKAGK